MAWELIQTEKQEWKQDDSGLYILINWDRNIGAFTHGNCIRVDVITTDHEPVISFVGAGHDVRIQLMRWLSECRAPGGGGIVIISLEHAAYIGSEIAKAELLKTEYVQD